MTNKTNMQANTQVSKAEQATINQNKGINLKINADISGTDGNESFNLHISGDYTCKNPNVYDWYRNSHKRNHQHHGNHSNNPQHNNHKQNQHNPQQPQQHNNHSNNPQHSKHNPQQPQCPQQNNELAHDMPTSTNIDYISDKELYLKTLKTAEAVLVREGSGEFEISIKIKIENIKNLLDVFDKLFGKHPDSVTYVDGSHMFISFKFGYYGNPLWIKSIAKDIANCNDDDELY